jgi:hypothetical protein
VRLRAFALLALAAVSFRSSEAQEKEKKPEPPRVTACAPLEVSPGVTATVRLRGLRLDSATELRFVPADPTIKAELKEKKKADAPNGLDVKEIGDTQLEMVLTVPAERPPGTLKYQVNTGGGWTPERELRVIAGAALIDEKEPNGGFREAQGIDRTKTLRGDIKEDKDVDVFAFKATAGERIETRVIAAQSASLLDPVLTMFDARGQFLCSNDDSAGSRDPMATLTAPSDGNYFVSVQDAGDRGGTFYAYELELKTVP